MNHAIGCLHACRFCYVAEIVKKQVANLLHYGVTDPDAEWGLYMLLRTWDEGAFMNSLVKAELDPQPAPDGNRSVIYSSTTDAYAVIKGVKNAKDLNDYSAFVIRRSLELIRDCSTLNVRILTRSPLAKRDFDLYKTFGDRLLFGMSLPTLDDRLGRIYEPGAPGVKQRLETLKAAKVAGLNVYVAVAPTYPECDEADLRRTLTAVKELDPITIFHEPINVRAENVERIKIHAAKIGEEVKLDVFDTPQSWREYSMEALMMVHEISEELGIADRLKLWPDAMLGAQGHFHKILKSEFELHNSGVSLTKGEKLALGELTKEAHERFIEWLEGWWGKISEWPGVPAQTGWTRPAVLTSSPFEPPTLDEVRERASKSVEGGSKT